VSWSVPTRRTSESTSALVPRTAPGATKGSPRIRIKTQQDSTITTLRITKRLIIGFDIEGNLSDCYKTLNPACMCPVNKLIAEVHFGERTLPVSRTNRELAYSPAQNEAFTTRIVDAAEALFLGKGQQLTGTPRCLSLQGVGLQAF
jgi:hypothetical protein